MMPEAKGVKFDQFEMALFQAKLSYHATIEERTALNNTNLKSIAEAQARILKGWEIQMQKGRDMGREENRSASDVRAMSQFHFRYTALETVAIETTGKR